MSKPIYDLGEHVLKQLKKRGIATMPRNYELFYNAMSGSYPALAKELEGLGAQPDQRAIDAIGNKHFPERLGAGLVNRAQNMLTAQLGDLSSMATSEAEGMRKMSSAMQGVKSTIGGGISEQEAMEALNKLIIAANIKAEGSSKMAEEFERQAVKIELLKQELDDLRKQNSTDSLTGALNRRAFNEYLAQIYQSGEASKYSFVIMDVDHFKSVNDKYGHPTGDRVLQMVSAAMRKNLRAEMPFFRFGGEEFCFFMKNLDANTTTTVANRLREVVKQQVLRDRTQTMSLAVTVSMGVCMGTDAPTPDDLLSKADEALYFSKENGRDRVTEYDKMMLIKNDSGKKLAMYR